MASCACAYLPQVVVTYELPDWFVAVCDYVPGDTLAQVVSEHQHLAPTRAVELIVPVCEAVSALHAVKVIHGDVAPKNIIVADDGAHVIDLGAARLADVDGQTGGSQGTWGFAAPEQYGFAQVDERSDVYGTGRLLGYMLTGVMPDSKMYGQALASPARVPDALRAVIERACSFEPSERFQTVDELYRAIVEATVPAHARVDSPQQAPAREGEGSTSADAASDDRTQRADAHDVADDDEAGATFDGSARLRRIHRRVVAALLLAAAIALGAVVIAAQAGVFDAVGSDGGAPADASAAATGRDPSKATAAEAAEMADDLQLVDSGWSVDEERGVVRYGFIVENTNDEFRINYPVVEIIGRNEDELVIFSAEQSVGAMYPGQTACYASYIMSDEVPTTVEFKVTPPDGWNATRADAEPNPYVCENVQSEVLGYGTVRVTCDVVRADGIDAEDIKELYPGNPYLAVTLLLRDADGDIIGGDTALYSAPEDGEQLFFSDTAVGVGFTSFEVYARPY